MGRANQYRYSSSKRVKVNFVAESLATMKSLTIQTSSFMSIGTTVIELREFKEKKKNNNMDKWYNFVKKWYLIFATQNCKIIKSRHNLNKYLIILAIPIERVLPLGIGELCYHHNCYFWVKSIWLA